MTKERKEPDLDGPTPIWNDTNAKEEAKKKSKYSNIYHISGLFSKHSSAPNKIPGLRQMYCKVYC